MSKKNGLDRNGYAPSIIPSDHCFFCEKTETARHEVFQGSGRREICKRNGLWCNLCPDHHCLVHDYKEWRLKLQIAFQREYEKEYTNTEFVKLIGKNYL